MMDFNLILLIAGLGLLALVLLFALWGFLGGLKRELSCIAVFIVLLVLSWLVFGDAATFLNAKVGQTVADMLNIKGDSITTLWDAILAYAKTVVPNGEALLVEGKETYSLFYSIVATVCRAAGLVIGTVAILVICPIIRFITHIICLIIRGVKKRKAKKLANENPKEKEEEPDRGGDRAQLRQTRRRRGTRDGEKRCGGRAACCRADAGENRDAPPHGRGTLPKGARVLYRTRTRLCDVAGGGAQAQGDLLHSLRGVCGR